MIIHFSILAVILSISFLWEKGTKSNKIKFPNYVMPLIPWLIIFGYIAFLAAMRTEMNDTSVYVASFKNTPGTIQSALNVLIGDSKDKGFYFFTEIFKMFISDNYHMWFAFFSFIESFCFIYILRKESVSIFDSCFFFFASTLYYNYFSMMRQWFAAALFFLAFKWLKQRKFIPYLLMCLCAAQFHNSAYVCIPIYFLVHDKPFCNKQLIYAFIIAIMLLVLNPLLETLENSSSTYSYVFDTMSQNTGSSPIRIIIAAVTVILSFLEAKTISIINNKTLNIVLNLSIINLILNIVATFTSGLYLIRMSVYFNIFNMLLFPFLLEIILKGNNKKIIKTGFFVFYLLFFVYQMSHQGSWGYSSDILGKYY